jgi:RNA polymerase sigma factor (sigma-70 family)
MTHTAGTDGLTMTEGTDLDLLTIIGCADIDEDQAERALEALYERYGRLLKGVASTCHWDTCGVDCDVLVQMAFVKVWENAATFDPTKRYGNTPESSAVKLWLLAILKNAFLDELRKVGRRYDEHPKAGESPINYRGGASDPFAAIEDCDTTDSTALTEAISFERDPGAITESRDVALTRQWLAAQSKDDRDLLYASAEYIDFRTGKFLIPPDQLSGLAAMLGVLPETIKVKRARLLRRLKIFLTDNR